MITLISFSCHVLNPPSYIDSITSYTPKKREGEKTRQEASGLYTTATFQATNAFLLSDTIVLSQWFLVLFHINSNGLFYFLSRVYEYCCFCVYETIMLSVCMWFIPSKRKPPDKKEQIWKELLMIAVDLIERGIHFCTRKDLDIIFWYHVLSSFLIEIVFDLLYLFIKVEYVSPITIQQEKEYENKRRKQRTTRFHEVNKRNYYRYKLKKDAIQCNLLMSLSSKKKQLDDVSGTSLDTDSYQVAIDTCTSESICSERELFVGKIHSCRRLYIQGVGGKVKVTGVGSIKFRITDDDDVTHDLLIHNVLYVPESPVNLISPQRWSETSTNPEGTGEITTGGVTILFWDNKQFTKLIPHHPDLKIPIMTVNDGFTKGAAFLAAGSMCIPCTPTYLHTSVPMSINSLSSQTKEIIVPLDDEEEDQSYHRMTTRSKSKKVDELDKLKSDKLLKIDNIEEIRDRVQLLDDVDSEQTSTTTFTDESDSVELEYDNNEKDDQVVEIPSNQLEDMMSSIDEKTTKRQKELLGHHYRLKHLPFSYLKRLAKKGIIPKYLENVPPPLCMPCLMGKQHRKPWRGKSKKSSKIRKLHETFPGANTSTDQMISPYGGLIPQMKGRLMKAKYYAATVFVDHYSDFTYVHLMRDTTAESTLEAKQAYEHLLQSYGHKVLAYHADNGRYAEKVFIKDVKDKAQRLTYCGVGSHHQNGIAERHIKSLSEESRTMLAHGQHLWPEVVTKSLWPFAFKAACRARNKFMIDSDGYSPEEKMSGIAARQELKNEHPLFCPVFVLDRRLQGGIGGIPKWDPRSNAGVYLGH